MLQSWQLGSVTGVAGVTVVAVGQCYRRYSRGSWAVVQRDSGTVGQWYSVTKKSSELAKPHSYWVLLILVAVSGYAGKIQRSMFTRYQRNTFY